MEKEKRIAMKKILITGGCGFIGRNLIEYLLRTLDCEITVLDNETNGSRTDLIGGVAFCHGDVKNQKDCHDAVAGQNVIVHLAAQTEVSKSVSLPIEDLRINTIGTLNLLEVARIHQIDKFIFASSNAVTGDIKTLPVDEETPTYPISPYGISKLAAENYCKIYNQMYNISTICLRFSNVYGKYSTRKSSVIAKFMNQINKGQPIQIYGNGQQTRDFIYVEALSSAIAASIFYKNQSHQTFCIGSGIGTTINKVVEIMKQLYYPKDVKVAYTEERPGDIKCNYSSITKAFEVLKWKPKITIEEGLKQLILGS